MSRNAFLLRNRTIIVFGIGVERNKADKLLPKKESSYIGKRLHLVEVTGGATLSDDVAAFLQANGIK